MEFKDEESLVKFVIGQKLPEWKQKLFKKNADAVQVHSQGQIFYKLDRLFPNEHPESKAHRILSFESITEASFGRAANNISRIFKNSSYTVEASDKTIDVLGQDDFEGKDFYEWFLDEWVKWALKEDPNARIAFYPVEYVKKGKPPACFIGSQNLKYQDEEVVVFISEEESVVEYELKEVCISSEVFFDQRIGRVNSRQATENTYTPKIETKIKRPVFHAFVLGVGFYRIEQDENEANHYFIDLYPIKQPFLPITDVGGDKSTNDVNKSFLHPFVAFGNLALLQHSQHTAVNFTFSFPRISEVETPCDAVGCNEGQVECELLNVTGDSITKNCAKCHGTGYTSSQSPYKVYKRKIDPNGMQGNEALADIDDVKFYTPDVAILDYSKNEWVVYLERAEMAVYVPQKVKTGNVESSDSKRVDQEDMFTFISRIGKVFFSRLRFAVQCFENYYISNPSQVSVTEPYSYAVLTEEEAFTALKTILESNVPVMFKANQIETFINKFVSMASPVKRFLDVLKIVDPLLYYTTDELTGYKVSGVITVEQLSIHVYAFHVLSNLFATNKQLFFQESKAIAAKVLEELKNFKPAPVEDLKTKFTPAE